MSKNNPANNLFDEYNTAEESFSVDYADTYEKEMHFADNNLNETILEKKIKESRNKGKNPNPNESFASFMQMEDLNALNEMVDKLNITIQNKQKEDYLYARKFPNFPLSDFQKVKNKVLPGLDQIRNSLLNIKTNYTQFDNNKKVGPLTPLSYVIESTYQFRPEFSNEMQKKYDRLKNYILNYRTIYGDGNCYYRAVIYRYIELLILNKKIDIFKLLIIDIYCSFQSNEIKKRLYVGNEMLNPKLIIQIMIIILELLESNRIAEAYKAFYDSILFSKIFDYSLILYLRFIIYIYIKNNENKLYLESFPVLIGNLLPSIYEKDGVFDFNSFYENFLLKMFQFAEKIVIYLTPFVLGVDLNVVLFDDNENEIVKKFGFAGKSELNIDDNIYILNRIGHYENIYSIEDNQKYNLIYGPYRNDIRARFINVDYSLNLNNTNNNYNNNQNNNSPNNNYPNNKNNQNNNYQNNNPSNYNQYYTQNSQNNIGVQKINDLQSKTVINQHQNNLRNMYFGNSNVNYNYQNNYYTNNNRCNNYHRSYTNDNIQYNPMNQNYNINTYNQNYNYQNNYYNQSNYYNQNNIYQSLNSFNQQNQTGNINNMNTYPKPYVNNNYGEEESYDSRKDIYYYNDVNNFKKDATYFNKDNNIYSLANANTNNNLNNNNSMNNSNNNNYLNNNNNNNYKNNNINNTTTTNSINNQQGYNFNNNVMNDNNIMNNSQQGYNINQQGNGQFKCFRCSSSTNGLNSNKNICYNCFISEVIRQLKLTYIEYLKNVTKLEKANTITKNDFNNLFLKKIIIDVDNNKYNIYQAIGELPKNNSDYHKIIEDIILKIKQQICLYCYCDVHNSDLKLPCGCNFCSIDHINSFINERVQNKITYNYKCFCSYEYEPNKTLELFIFLKAKNIIKDYHIFIQKLNQLFCKICFKCGKENMDLSTVDIEGFIPNQFTHLICEECIQSGNTNQVQCSICKIQHKYLLKDF